MPEADPAPERDNNSIGGTRPMINLISEFWKRVIKTVIEIVLDLLRKKINK